MAKPFANDRGLIRCPYNKCVNNDKHQPYMLKNHIFRYGFMGRRHEVWTYHRENANAMVTSNMLEQNEGIPDMDEMFDVLDDIISDDAEVDLVTAKTSNVQYNELFEALNSKLYLGVFSFSSLNFLVKLMHLNVLNKWTNKSFDELLKLLKLAFPKTDLVDFHYEAKNLSTKMSLGYKFIHVAQMNVHSSGMKTLRKKYVMCAWKFVGNCK